MFVRLGQPDLQQTCPAGTVGTKVNLSGWDSQTYSKLVRLGQPDLQQTCPAGTVGTKVNLSGWGSRSYSELARYLDSLPAALRQHQRRIRVELVDRHLRQPPGGYLLDDFARPAFRPDFDF